MEARADRHGDRALQPWRRHRCPGPRCGARVAAPLGPDGDCRKRCRRRRAHRHAQGDRSQTGRPDAAGAIAFAHAAQALADVQGHRPGDAVVAGVSLLGDARCRRRRLGGAGQDHGRCRAPLQDIGSALLAGDNREHRPLASANAQCRECVAQPDRCQLQGRRTTDHRHRRQQRQPRHHGHHGRVAALQGRDTEGRDDDGRQAVVGRAGNSERDRSRLPRLRRGDLVRPVRAQGHATEHRSRHCSSRSRSGQGGRLAQGIRHDRVGGHRQHTG